MIMMSHKWIGLGLSCWPKIPYVLLTISTLLTLTSAKTLCPAYALTSSKDRYIGPN